jgi:hypothetical protein
MITQVKVGQNYINVSVAITNNSGQRIDPTNAEAWFYKISQIDGSISLDTNIGGTGKVTLLKQGAQIGFYGASINISSFSETEYVILYKITADVAETITVEYLSIDLSKKQIGEIKTDTTSIISTLSTLVVNIWTYGTRTLTSFGTLVADIAIAVWTYITRTLTAGTKDAEIDAIKLQTEKIPLIQIETDKIKKILGLTQENFKLYNCVYSGTNLTSANIKIYPTSTDLEADTNVIATYSIIATFDGDGKCTSYKVKLI